MNESDSIRRVVLVLVLAVLASDIDVDLTKELRDEISFWQSDTEESLRDDVPVDVVESSFLSPWRLQSFLSQIMLSSSWSKKLGGRTAL